MTPKASQLDFNELFDESPQTGLRHNTAPDSVDEWVGNRRPKKRSTTTSQRVIDEYIAESTKRAGTGDWEGAKPHHLVGLYIVCHERVYGVKPIEIAPSTFLFVTQMAKHQLRARFDDDTTAAVEYMRWLWDRERNRREYQDRRARESNQIAGEMRRIGWRLHFSITSPLITDYLIHCKRR